MSKTGIIFRQFLTLDQRWQERSASPQSFVKQSILLSMLYSQKCYCSHVLSQQFLGKDVKLKHWKTESRKHTLYRRKSIKNIIPNFKCSLSFLLHVKWRNVTFTCMESSMQGSHQASIRTNKKSPTVPQITPEGIGTLTMLLLT